MAGAWGTSWGVSWGASWGSLAPDVRRAVTATDDLQMPVDGVLADDQPGIRVARDLMRVTKE